MNIMVTRSAAFTSFQAIRKLEHQASMFIQIILITWIVNDLTITAHWQVLQNGFVKQQLQPQPQGLWIRCIYT